MLTIEKRKFDLFLLDFRKGKYGNQRLGQAFYNEWNLHRTSEDIFNIYAKDGKHALNSIKANVIFS